MCELVLLELHLSHMKYGITGIETEGLTKIYLYALKIFINFIQIIHGKQVGVYCEVQKCLNVHENAPYLPVAAMCIDRAIVQSVQRF